MSVTTGPYSDDEQNVPCFKHVPITYDTAGPNRWWPFEVLSNDLDYQVRELTTDPGG